MAMLGVIMFNFKFGDIVWAYWLHDDSAKLADCQRRVIGGNERMYHVPGKRRPVLFFQSEDQHIRGMKITSVSSPRTSAHLVCLNDIFGDGKISFLDIREMRNIPRELVDVSSGAQGTLKRNTFLEVIDKARSSGRVPMATYVNSLLMEWGNANSQSFIRR
jgi:hypothetical protein